MAEITYRDAIAQALREELRGDDRVFLMGEDIGRYGGSYVVTKGFLDEFGEERVKPSYQFSNGQGIVAPDQSRTAEPAATAPVPTPTPAPPPLRRHQAPTPPFNPFGRR